MAEGYFSPDVPGRGGERAGAINRACKGAGLVNRGGSVIDNAAGDVPDDLSKRERTAWAAPARKPKPSLAFGARKASNDTTTVPARAEARLSTSKANPVHRRWNVLHATNTPFFRPAFLISC
ncbi:hypothetical protein KM043_008839 [Ampulex compressa]|nr:hypothetical protein KM043_008839 [Ampulex compressa]